MNCEGLESLRPAGGPPRADRPTPTGSDAAARKHGVLPMPKLEWNEEVARETAHLYERIKTIVPAVEWPVFAPYVKAINELKRQRNAVILAHNYQTPEIYNCVADFVGDSLQLAREAAKVKADVIVQGGVHFMAETSKILSPDKDRADPGHARRLFARLRHHRRRCAPAARALPGVPVVVYVNTSAEVKAESDICCTSSNALQVVESLGTDTVIFLPDQYLAKYVASQTKVKIIAWQGACEVHERFHRRRAAPVSRERSGPADHRASGMSARRDRGSRFHRLDRAHDRLGAQQQAQARGHGHRMLDGRQCAGGIAGRRIRAPMQSLPAHEAHHTAEDPRKPRLL